MKYNIRLFGNPVLRQEGARVTAFDADLAQLVQDMIETMHEAQGIGLASQQIGKALRLCIVEVPEDMDMDERETRLNPDLSMPLVIVNPEIIELSGDKFTYSEGCLSFPEITGPVVRPDCIHLRYQDAQGEAHELKAQGLISRALQHEIDHLNGVLFIDHMSRVRKAAMSGRLKRLSQEGRAQAAG